MQRYHTAMTCAANKRTGVPVSVCGCHRMAGGVARSHVQDFIGVKRSWTREHENISKAHSLCSHRHIQCCRTLPVAIQSLWLQRTTQFSHVGERRKAFEQSKICDRF